MKTLARRALAVALAAGGVASVSSAQNDVVVPNSFAATAGGGGLNTLLRDTANPRCYQVIYAASELTGVVGQDLVAVTWRMSAASIPFPPATHTYSWTDYQVRVGTPATSPATMSTTFSANLNGSEVLVRSGPLTLNAVNFPGRTNPINPFGGTIVFTTPFHYTGGDLIIDIRHPGGTFTNANGFLDGLLTTQTAQGYGTTVRGLSQNIYPTPTTGAFTNGFISRLTFTPSATATGGCCADDGTCSVGTLASCLANRGAYRGDSTSCAPACPAAGGCCKLDGSCTVVTQAACNLTGGTYAGDGVTCAAAACAQTGACCLPNAGCVSITSADCTAQGGTFAGVGVLCASASCWSSPVLYHNGGLVTHPAGGAGGADASQLATGANTIGENWNFAAFVRIADQFTVPPGQQWTVNKFRTFGYQTNAPTTPVPYTAMYVRLWDRDPRDPAAVVVWGDLTTNVLDTANSGWSNAYRVTTNLADTARALFNLVANVPNVVLGPGTYWVEWSGSNGVTPFMPAVTSRNASGVVGIPFGNAIIWRNFPWAPVVDIGYRQANFVNAGGFPTNLPFILEGTSASTACYANCDASTQAPVLNVGDFTCFLQKFTAQDPYANCDASTQPPVLNVGDFTCFLQKYTAGCP